MDLVSCHRSGRHSQGTALFRALTGWNWAFGRSRRMRTLQGIQSSLEFESQQNCSVLTAPPSKWDERPGILAEASKELVDNFGRLFRVVAGRLAGKRLTAGIVNRSIHCGQLDLLTCFSEFSRNLMRRSGGICRIFLRRSFFPETANDNIL